MRIAFYTLGCKVNQYETRILMQLFSAEGFDVVPPEEEADVYVVNSCTVTATGDQKTRQILRRFKRRNPAAIVALTGCFAQAFPDAAAAIPEADVITGSSNRAGLLGAVKEALATGQRVIDIAPHQRGEAFEPMASQGFFERTRASVKIQDGCERYCSYCIIPTARGPVRSKPLGALEAELRQLASAGYREVVLVGINLSCYGQDTGHRLIDAVELACSIPGIERVRLGSLEPELLSGPDIHRMSLLPQMCGQFHLSLQSGCDETLRRMNRHYTTEVYRGIVKDLRRHFENCAITTDVMVGFPGETEAEFAQSLAFVREIGFAKTHVFSYSPRPGTRAAAMAGQIPAAEKEARSARMIEAAAGVRGAFLQAQCGLCEEVLFETGMPGGYYVGYTQNYTPVRVQAAEDLRGKIRTVKICSAEDDNCTGELV